MTTIKERYACDVPMATATPHPRAPRGGHHLAIFVDDIEAAIAYLREQPGVTILGEPQLIEEGPIAGNRWIYVLTPWGLQMEIMNQPPGAPYEKETAARRFGPATAWDAR